MEKRGAASLRKRIFLNAALFVGLIVLVLAGMFFLRGELLRETNESYTLLVENYEQQEESRFDFYSSLLELSTNYIAQMKERGATTKEIEDSLYAFLKGYDHIYDGISSHCFGIIDGVVISNAKEFEGKEHIFDYTKEPWYQVALEAGGGIRATDLYNDYLTGEPCVTIVQKIPGSDDVLAFDIFFTSRAASSTNLGLPTESSYYLCDASGKIMYMSTPFEVSYDVAQSYVTGILDSESRDLKAFKDEKYVGPDQVRRTAYVQKCDNGWYVILTVPGSTVERELAPFYIAIWILAGIWIVMTLVFSIRDYRHEKRRQRLIVERDFVVRDREIFEKSTESILSAYRELFFIDLEKDRMQVVYTSNPDERRSSLYTASLDRYLSYGGIDPSEAEGVRSALELKNLRSQLSVNDYIEVRFRVLAPKGTGSPETFVVTVAAIERVDGLPVSAVMSIRSIENILQREKAQRELLESATEQAEAASLAKSDFLSRMSHDIRTPMNAIQGMTTLALMNIDDRERVLDSLMKIDDSSKHLLSLINSVLDMSKIESGHMVLSEAPFDVCAMLKKIQGMFEVQANNKNINLSFDVSGIEDPYVVGDAGRLQELLVNIIGNALKFTDEGGSVKVLAEEKDVRVSDKQCFQFVVADTGVGMPPDFVEHIFEPFARVESEREGTGLGMPIALNMARLMGGDIQVESELGKGSKFTVAVYLKISESHEKGRAAGERGVDSDARAASEHESDIKSFSDHDFNGSRALLVDDVEINNEISAELLATVGVETVTVANGQEAVDALLESEPGTFDLVFMDVQMPVMDGYEASRIIRASGREDLLKLPIIAVTANAFIEDVERAKQAGMNDHVSKPLNLKVLEAMLVKWLDKS